MSSITTTNAAPLAQNDQPANTGDQEHTASPKPPIAELSSFTDYAWVKDEGLDEDLVVASALNEAYGRFLSTRKVVVPGGRSLSIDPAVHRLVATLRAKQMADDLEDSNPFHGEEVRQ